LIAPILLAAQLIIRDKSLTKKQRNLKEFRPEWIRITSAGQNEAKPHLIK
jgi:hypothetical protein